MKNEMQFENEMWIDIIAAKSSKYSNITIA